MARKMIKKIRTYTEETLPKGVTLKMLKRFAQADRLAARHAEIRAQLRDEILPLFPHGTHVIGNIVIERGESSVTDKTAIERDFPRERYPELYKTVLDLSQVPADVKKNYTATPTQTVKVRD